MYCAIKNNLVYVYANDGRNIRQLRPAPQYGMIVGAQINGDEVAIQCQKDHFHWVLLYHVDGRMIRQTRVR